MARETKSDAEDVLIVSVSSDIGEHLALHYLRRGCRVFGTYRKAAPASVARHPRFVGLCCDVFRPESAVALAHFLAQYGIRWQCFISCVGQLSPIGLFFDNDFEAWAASVEVNSVAQLRALHASWPFRTEGMAHAVFFAGGGTNNPFGSYSAYCLGKIALIKMCELLDDENPDLNPFIVGTGWVRTKIHEQTLAAGSRAGANVEKTKEFLSRGITGTTYADIAAMIDWGVAQGKTVAGGRNFSVVHDAWRNGGADLASVLRANGEGFKLRRHGNG